MSEIILNQGAAPNSPSTGSVKIYVNSSGSLCLTKADGTSFVITMTPTA